MRKEFGKRVEKIRTDMGMTKAKFAAMIGVSGQYLGTVEHGVNGFAMETVAILCEKTGVSADYLLFGKNELTSDVAARTVLSDFSPEQLQVAFDILKKMAVFLRTDNANEILIKEIFRSKLSGRAIG
ncbi:MAG: helix-turn-helix domain-containing protein [Firmicutes bacterium]|nr:helix-turn-helix domain-containing protein [Bacillota bacterium]